MRTARDVPTPLLCRNSMISRTTFCSAQPAMIRSARFGPIPVTSRRRSGSCWMPSDVEHGDAERAYEPPRIGRPAAADHAGAEIFLDPLSRGWRCSLEERGFGLDPARTVVDPGPARLHELAGRYHRRMADESN